MEPSSSLSFAIPCRNGAKYLPALLRSLLEQEGPLPKILLVDDASTDGSVQIAKEIGGERIQVFRHEGTLGIPENWNRCAALVDTEFFCLAHQDDLYRPSFGRRMVEALRASPEACFAHCQAQSVDAEGRPLHSLIDRRKAVFFREEEDEGTAALAFLFSGNWITCPSIVFRTEAFRRWGSFDARYHFVPDWEYSFRVLLGGGRIKAVPEILLSYRRHEEQATREAISDFERYREELALLNKVREQATLLGLGESLPEKPAAVRNNLLFDAYQDLLQGRRREALEKLRFAAKELPGCRWDVLVLGTRLLAPLGRLGGKTLSLGLQLFLRA